MQTEFGLLQQFSGTPLPECGMLQGNPSPSMESINV